METNMPVNCNYFCGFVDIWYDEPVCARFIVSMENAWMKWTQQLSTPKVFFFYFIGLNVVHLLHLQYFNVYYVYIFSLPSNFLLYNSLRYAAIMTNRPDVVSNLDRMKCCPSFYLGLIDEGKEFNELLNW